MIRTYNHHECHSPLIWVSGGKKCVFLIKTVLNGGICANFSSFKSGTMLIETVLSGDPLYYRYLVLTVRYVRANG